MTALLGLIWTRVAQLSHIRPLIPVSPLPNRPACVRNVLQSTGERQKTRQVTFADTLQAPNNLNTVRPYQASCTGSTVYLLELIIVVISLASSIRDTSHRPPGASSVLTCRRYGWQSDWIRLPDPGNDQNQRFSKIGVTGYRPPYGVCDGAQK